MALLLRSLARDPLVTRPLSRAFARRFGDDFWLDELPPKKMRRFAGYDSPTNWVDDVNRQMVAAMNRMQDFAEDLDALDSWVSRLDNQNRSKAIKQRREEALVKRTESGGLQLALDVSDFKPEDLRIKIQDDNLLIEGVSEHSGKDSYRRNHFKRWFKLPEDCKLNEIKSKLTEDNRLLIDLPTTKPIEDNNSTRTIPIEMEKPSQTIGQNQSAQEASQKKIASDGQK